MNPEGTNGIANYPYKGMPLSRPIAIDFIKERFAGTQAKREEIARAVCSDHQKRGGLPPENVFSVFHNALARMKKFGEAEPGDFYGYWKILPKNGCVTMPSRSKRDLEVSEIGEGSKFIYVDYYPSQKREDRWPCKVGRTGNPKKRAQQLGTANHEKLVHALRIRTDEHGLLERTLHYFLTIAGYGINRDWFRTTPEEVAGIYETLKREIALLKHAGASLAGNSD
ncbi:MAG TPA: GIY-YIG nuclease family protein [Chthoniobacterales bacterium]|nr:GIY-YIG nuclease family protein [Chthoniobacterales bacterium]